MDWRAITRGTPVFVRFDNGTEFSAIAVADWCGINSIGTCFIDSGSPWQNGWIGSFNGLLRDESPNGDPSMTHHLKSRREVGTFRGHQRGLHLGH